MKISWEIEDRVAEFRIYEGLSIAHYYIGSIEQSRTYHQKYLMGPNSNKESGSQIAHVAIN